MIKNIFFAILLLIITLNVNAGRGCCSWHGGQDYCDTSVGKWVCKDGTYSQSCKCPLDFSDNNPTTFNEDKSNSNEDIQLKKEYESKPMTIWQTIFVIFMFVWPIIVIVRGKIDELKNKRK